MFWIQFNQKEYILVKSRYIVNAADLATVVVPESAATVEAIYYL